MRTLITGGHGFVGRHLAQHLAKCGDDLALTYHPKVDKDQSVSSDQATMAPPTPIPRAAQALALDVTDRKAVNDVIELLKPDTVYHLAAISYVPEAEAELDNLINTNYTVTLNLLEAVKRHSPESKVLLVSSAEVYGEPVPGSLPLQETAVMRPITAYGMTKAAADSAGFKYFFRDGVKVVRVRPFPHIGPGQSDRFAISGFAKQVAQIKLGKRRPQIHVGNLDPKRDFCDVSDVVRGYREALLNGKPGDVYNLCSGQSYEIGDVLNRLIKLAEVEAEVVVDPGRVRPVDIIDSFGSNEKAHRDFGWKPRVEFEATLSGLLSYWLESLA